MDVITGEVTQLTHDRHSVLQPAYAPDGRTIAFVTDAGPGTDFERLVFGPNRIALLDRESGEVDVLDLLEGAEHWNPQFTPDGQGLFFLSDPDGFRDIYRVDLDDGRLVRVTRIATAVSGITDATPALSVAAQAGTVAFSVFDGGEFHIHALDAVDLEGETMAAMELTAPDGRRLPGGAMDADAWINRILADAEVGLPAPGTYRAADAGRADRSLGLDFIGQATVGVGADQFGTMTTGSISALFSDLFGDRTLYTAIQAQGEFRDIGGQVFYQEEQRRWNWGLGLAQIPTRFFRTGIIDEVGGGATVVREDQRIRATEAQGLISYPFSTTHRVDLNLG